jgi:hypothetical protein
LDPEAPKPEDRRDSGSNGSDSARKRASSLTEKKADSGAAGNGGDKGPRPVLTEKQRIEARRARQAKRRRPVKGNPLSKGMRATGFEIRRTASFLGGSVIAALGALGPVFSSVGMGLVWLIERIGEGVKVLGRLIGRAVALTGRFAVALDRVVTPHRALLLVAALAAVLLGVSQYKGLGAIEIGQAGYAGIEDLARAPAIDRTTPAGVHTQILVPIAAIAFAAVVVIALGSIGSFAGRFVRWRRLASMVLVVIGLLTLAVTLLIDLPDATDTSKAALAYAGVKAILLSGFWLQLAAGAALTVSGLALLFEPSKGAARGRKQNDRERGKQEGSRRKSRRSPVADGSGMTGSQA